MAAAVGNIFSKMPSRFFDLEKVPLFVTKLFSWRHDSTNFRRAGILLKVDNLLHKLAIILPEPELIGFAGKMPDMSWLLKAL